MIVHFASGYALTVGGFKVNWGGDRMLSYHLQQVATMAELIIKFFQEQRELLVYFCEEIADIDYDESKNEEKYGVHFRSKWFSPRAIEPSRVLGTFKLLLQDNIY